jgi:hypothetical protein
VTCTAEPRRAGMSDGDYWVDVATSLLGAGPDLEDNLDDANDDILDDAGSYTSACRVCGAGGACGYDAEGQPLIHAQGAQ